MRALLIDGGQSGCRAAVIDQGRTVAETTLPGLPRQGRDYAALRGLLELADGIEVVAAGLTGFRGGVQAVATALPAPRVVVSDDAVTAHLGALGGEPGVVIVAGTGAIALAVDEVAARADGWGTRLGDDGGGYWIGRAGLALALRAHDGRGGSHDLLARAMARFGAPNPERSAAACASASRSPRLCPAARRARTAALLRDAPVGAEVAAERRAVPSARGAGAIVSAVYDAADPVAVIASFARDVADAARAGDAPARRIWDEAGRELARTAAAAARRVGLDGPFSYAGGLFAAGELILEPLRAELGELRQPLGDRSTARPG